MFIMIKNSFRKLLLNKKASFVVVNVFLFFFLLFLVFIPKSFAVVINSMKLTSSATNYDNNEAGAWKVDVNAKWVDRGIAEIIFDVATIVKQKSKNTDLLLVLDMSESMRGDKLDNVKIATSELVNSVLAKSGNKIGITSFDTGSKIVTEFTSDKNTLLEKVNELECGGQTNYYQALVNVDKILKNYIEERNRNCVVLFLTDGYPNVDSPNEIAEYRYLKSEYPYVTINAVQYEMGDSVISPIKKISDEQFAASSKSLSKTMYAASNISESYSKFEITNYIDDRYFYVEDINTSYGSTNLDENSQVVTWRIEGLRTGSNERLTMKVKLKSEFVGKEGEYSLSKQTDIQSKLLDNEESISNQSTLVLSSSYKIKYDTNLPSDCSVVGNIPSDEIHSLFDVVKIPSSNLKCDNYYFKGWKLVNDNVQKINDDYLVMPENDITFRATWGKTSVTKTIAGVEAKEHTITYNLGGGTVSGNPTSYYDNQENFVLKKPTRSGYTFAGWTGTDLNEAIYNVTVDTSKNKDYTFTAKWIKNEITRYDGLPSSTINGCMLNDVYIDVEVNDCLTVFLNVSGSPTLVEAPTWSNADQSDIDFGPLDKGSWTREGRTFNYGYTFAGKTAIKTYTTHVYLTCGGTRQMYSGFNNYILKSSTYFLDYNNGTSTKITSGKYNYGSNVSLSSVSKPTKSGYTFIGWSTSATSPSKIITSFRIGVGGNTFYGTFIKTSNI